MNEKIRAKEKGQSLALVAAAMVVLVGFVALAVDLGNAYYARRTAQNAADGAALAGASRLSAEINDKKNWVEKQVDIAVEEDMIEFAQLNGIEDTNDDPEDSENGNVDGWYVDTDGNRILDENGVEIMVGTETVPENAAGVEAITYITATAYFGGIFGFDGYPVQARAVSHIKLACGSNCVIPVTTDVDYLLDDYGEPRLNECFNVWLEREKPDGSMPMGVLGWVNWTWQWSMCTDTTYGDGRPCPNIVQDGQGCDTDLLHRNLDHDNCASGFIRVGDWMASASGVMNANEVRCQLDYYLGPESAYDVNCTDGIQGHSFTIPVYATTTVDIHPTVNPVPCKVMSAPYDPEIMTDYKESDGLHYQVAGFARMQILGYRLSSGVAVPGVEIFDPSQCVTATHGITLTDAFRISAEFIDYVQDYDTSSECYDPFGTLWASPKLTD